MSILTTWTSVRVPPRPPQPRGELRLRTAWDCHNCSALNPGLRKRCTECGTSRD